SVPPQWTDGFVPYPELDGTVAIDLDPLSLLCRLAAAVPPPYFHTVRYAGVLSAASKLRSLVVPPPPESSVATADGHVNARGVHVPLPPKPKPATHRSRYRPWAERLKRSFALDVQTCARCGGRTNLIALVTNPTEHREILAPSRRAHRSACCCACPRSA